MTIFVTGGSGFIGSNFIIQWFKNKSETLVNIDKLTYASDINNIGAINKKQNYHFHQEDIGDRKAIENLFSKYKPRAIINFAAESHVDNSINNPNIFIQTNINGTFELLQVARNYWDNLANADKDNFLFLHVSTDEVFGSLGISEEPFTETHRYKPNSPYSASKASSDHLVRAFGKTYSLPVIVTNCSNNFGPFQHAEKLIPKTIISAINAKEIPIYGNGLQIRDWLYVTDHCDALMTVLEKGTSQETYNIGGANELSNLELVNLICETLSRKVNKTQNKNFTDLIRFVEDRPGHDTRYAIDNTKINKILGWKPKESIITGIDKTIDWYLSFI